MMLLSDHLVEILIGLRTNQWPLFTSLFWKCWLEGLATFFQQCPQNNLIFLQGAYSYS